MELPELDIFDDPGYNSKLDSARVLIASGKKSDLVEKCESGHAAIASVFFDATEHGGAGETSLSARLAKAMATLPKPKVRKSKGNGNTSWFVEFCCAQSTARSES